MLSTCHHEKQVSLEVQLQLETSQKCNRMCNRHPRVPLLMSAAQSGAARHPKAMAPAHPNTHLALTCSPLLALRQCPLLHLPSYRYCAAGCLGRGNITAFIRNGHCADLWHHNSSCKSSVRLCAQKRSPRLNKQFGHQGETKPVIRSPSNHQRTNTPRKYSQN